MKDWSKELRELLKVGSAVRIHYNDGNLNNHIDHIRAIVDDDVIVSRRWSRAKSRWRYKTEPVSWYALLLDQGHLSRHEK